MRVGQGFDAHRLVPGRRLMLGGVEVPHDRGLEAHSDGDVAVHALCDALLGAAGLGDIGRYFPATDAFRDISGRELLSRVMSKVRARGLHLVNADLTIIAQAPRLAPHIASMRAALAAAAEVDEEAVSVKATTTDGLGFAGAGEGIMALAAVLLDADTPP